MKNDPEKNLKLLIYKGCSLREFERVERGNERDELEGVYFPFVSFLKRERKRKVVYIEKIIEEGTGKGVVSWYLEGR